MPRRPPDRLVTSAWRKPFSTSGERPTTKSALVSMPSTLDTVA